MRRRRALQEEERLALGGSWHNEFNLVFTTVFGTPVQGKNMVRRDFKRLLEEASLPPIRFHDLRHTCATLLLSAGEHPKVVSELLGHASVVLTLDTYSHVLPNIQQHAAARMQDILTTATSEGEANR